MELSPLPAKGAIEIWSDASGHCLSSPSIGIFIPVSGYHNPLVASLALPRAFLQATDHDGKKAFCKTTTLECLAYVAVLCIDPHRFVENEVLFHIDNVASVIALEKGRSRDPWASTLVRAARVIAASLGCTLFSEWEGRRSTRESRIADDLTDNLVANLDDLELSTYLSSNYIEFPEPILNWMANTSTDLTLGKRCIEWIRSRSPEIKLLHPPLV